MRYEKIPNSPSHDNYFAEMVDEITDNYSTMRDFFITVVISECMHKGEFDMLGGIVQHSANKRIFGVAFLNDVEKNTYPKENFEKNKAKFLEASKALNGLFDVNVKYKELLEKFLEWSDNIHPRNAAIVQTFDLTFTEFGGIIPRVTTKFENKIDYLGKDFMQSNINNLEELYSG